MSLYSEHTKDAKFQMILGFLSNLITITNFINFYCISSYTAKLNNESCECSNEWQQKFMNFYNKLMNINFIINFIDTVLRQKPIYHINL